MKQTRRFSHGSSEVSGSLVEGQKIQHDRVLNLKYICF